MRHSVFWSAVCVLAILVVFLLTSCGARAAVKAVADNVATHPPAEPVKPAALADADAQISASRDDVATLTAKLAFARALLEVKEAGRIQIAKDAERDARQAQLAAQARWLTWIAGLVFLVGIAAAIAGFWLPIPKRWGAIAAAGGLALLVAARVWSWAGDHALPIGLVVLAIGACAGLRAWWRTASAAKHIASIGDRLEAATGHGERDLVKAFAFEEQRKSGTVDLVRRLRGKPRKLSPTATT